MVKPTPNDVHRYDRDTRDMGNTKNYPRTKQYLGWSSRVLGFGFGIAAGVMAIFSNITEFNQARPSSGARPGGDRRGGNEHRGRR